MATDWRKAVYERDDYTCQWCGVRGGRMAADHILPWALFPEKRFDVSNGRTLCQPCHNLITMSPKLMRKIYIEAGFRGATRESLLQIKAALSQKKIDKPACL